MGILCTSTNLFNTLNTMPTPALINPHFQGLDQAGLIQAEYVWIGGNRTDVRSKSRTLNFIPKSPAELPEWNYDGSSTNQAPGDDSEVILKPCRIYKDPFRGGDNILVLCATYTPQGEPLPTNHRHHCNEVMEKHQAEHPWFGIEQEYTILTLKGWPLGWPDNGFPAPQGPYYCAAGGANVFGRGIVEDHYRACLYAGVKISGVNGEVMPGQFEFQVGPCEGIQMGDDLWIARYLLDRISELHACQISLDPKPVPGDWNGAGRHCNYSTEKMRLEGGYQVILSAIKKLEAKHEEHIQVYGEGNERRLTGAHETASIDKFSYGVANRGASIRIPRQTEKDGKGYLEDRRPASNIDPYVVTAKIVDTTCL